MNDPFQRQRDEAEGHRMPITKHQADHVIKMLHQIAAAQLRMIDAIAAMRLHQTSTLAQNENRRMEDKRMAQLLKEVKT